MSTTTTTTTGATTGTSAADIVAALRHMCHRDMRHEPTPGQLHRLLYLAQGHHLGWFGTPLFGDTIVITDVGVLVAGLRGHENDSEPGYGDITNADLNTAGYVLSRYGNLSLHDLDLLTRHSAPVVEAGRGRRAGTVAPIRPDAMADYFAHVVDTDPDSPMVDAASLARLVDGAEARRQEPGKADDMDRIQARADELRRKMSERSA